MSDTTTLRLVIQEWHGGVNPDYVMGARLMDVIAPVPRDCRTAHVDVDMDFDADLRLDDGVRAGRQLVDQLGRTKAILDERRPEHVLTIGGGETARSSRPRSIISPASMTILGSSGWTRTPTSPTPASPSICMRWCSATCSVAVVRPVRPPMWSIRSIPHMC